MTFPPIQLAFDHEATIQAAFATFHVKHPEVYTELVRFTRIALLGRAAPIGIALIWERMRWHFLVDSDATEEFKLNNNYRSRYARLIMQQEPGLGNAFETRILRSA